MLVRIVLLSVILQSNFKWSKNEVVKSKQQRELTLPTIEIFNSLLNATLTDYKNLTFKTLTEKYFLKEYFERYSAVPSFSKKLTCKSCELMGHTFIFLVRIGLNPKNFAYSLCNLVQHLVDKSTCRSAIDLNIDIIIYIVSNRKYLTPQLLCAIVLQSHGCYKEARPKWQIDIPSGNSVTRPIKNESTPFRVLQLTDVHMDPMYTVGASSKCGKPLCCQSDNEHNVVYGAGYWGSYGACDMPWHLMKDFLDNILERHKKTPFSYVYFTGDIISHRVWQTSKESNTQQIKKMYNMLKQKLGSIPMFPTIGNHEAHPVNIFSPFSVPEKFSVKWLYELLAEEWSQWLPKTALNTIREGGYYSVLVKPGFRVLVYRNIDQYEQLKWLVRELKQAEDLNEIVHILGHSPPGDSECLTAWASEFQRIIERFANTITAYFNGHTHFDELKVFYNTSNLLQPINVAFNGGSLTTYIDLNPNYRIYDIDSNTFKVLNYHQWIYQVPQANVFPNRSIAWYKLYSFKETYGLESLELNDLDDLVQRMAHNKTLQHNYFRYKVRDAEPMMTKGCDETCMMNNLCSIVTTVFDEKQKCTSLLL